MLTILTYFGYTLLGFGTGGLVYRNYKAKEINQEYGKFKKEAENEITQIKGNKEKYVVKNLELTKENTELQKLQNRSLRNIELLQTELMATKQLLLEQIKENKAATKEPKAENSIDNYFNN